MRNARANSLLPSSLYWKPLCGVRRFVFLVVCFFFFLKKINTFFTRLLIKLTVWSGSDANSINQVNDKPQAGGIPRCLLPVSGPEPLWLWRRNALRNVWMLGLNRLLYLSVHSDINYLNFNSRLLCTYSKRLLTYRGICFFFFHAK